MSRGRVPDRSCARASASIRGAFLPRCRTASAGRGSALDDADGSITVRRRATSPDVVTHRSRHDLQDQDLRRGRRAGANGASTPTHSVRHPDDRHRRPRHAGGVPDLVPALGAERSRPCALESSVSPSAPPRLAIALFGVPLALAVLQYAMQAERNQLRSVADAVAIVVAADIDDEEPIGDVGRYGSIDVAVYNADGVLLGGRWPAGPEPAARPGSRRPCGKWDRGRPPRRGGSRHARR